MVATKGGLECHPDGSFPLNASPSHLRRACEASLRALGVDCIDLYQLHAPDPAVPFTDSVGALSRMRSAGKIRHLGLSNVSLRQIQAAETIVPIASVQNCLNPFVRHDLHCGVLAHCEARGMAYIAYAPFGGIEQKRQIAENETLRRLGDRHGASPFQIALAWLLTRSAVVIPIPGARRLEAVASNAAAAHVRLSPEDMIELAHAFP
jgi:aryl-alcohol dehydrogenase-like predicted oxidoreductase